MKFKAIIFFVSLALPAISQTTFSKVISIDGAWIDAGMAIEVMDDGFLVMTGHTDAFPSPGYIQYGGFLKIDWEGNVLWENIPPHPGNNFRPGANNQIFIRGDKIYAAGGVLDTVNEFDNMLWCFNFEGDTIWTETYIEEENNYHWAILNTKDDHFLQRSSLPKTDVPPGGARDDIKLFKTDTLGNILWEGLYNTDFKRQIPGNMEQLPDGSIVMAVNTGAESGPWEHATLFKIDQDGNETWTKTYNATLGDAIPQVVPLSDGRLAMSWVIDTTNSSISPYPPTVFFLDSMGVKQDSFIFNQVTALDLLELYELSNGDLLGVGYSVNFLPPREGGWLFRLGPDGELKWQRHIADDRFVYEPFGSFFGHLWTAAECPDGGILAAGFLYQESGDADVWVVKLDENGCMDGFPCDNDTLIVDEVNSTIGTNKPIENFSISPNPASDFFQVGTDEMLSLNDTQLEITDAFGRKLKLVEMKSNPQKINISNLRNGTYFVSLTNKGRSSPLRKLVIAR